MGENSSYITFSICSFTSNLESMSRNIVIFIFTFHNIMNIASAQDDISIDLCKCFIIHRNTMVNVSSCLMCFMCDKFIGFRLKGCVLKLSATTSVYHCNYSNKIF